MGDDFPEVEPEPIDIGVQEEQAVRDEIVKLRTDFKTRLIMQSVFRLLARRTGLPAVAPGLGPRR
jgi:hypothetical protein